MRKIIYLLMFLACIPALAQEGPPQVSVVGEGTVNVVPDQVVIRARVEHTGKSVQKIKTENDKVVQDIINYLKSQGIPSRNIQTEYLNLRKEHNYNTKEDYYAANQALSVKLEDISSYEEVMSGLLELGLNRIDGVSFSSSQEDELKTEARKRAVLDARKKATEYAQALDQKIGPAFKISEVTSNGYQPVMRMMEMKSSDSGSGESIALGELEIEVKVNVSFMLKGNFLE